MKIRLLELPTPLSIISLYEIVAEKAGYDPKNCTYDCTKIEVSTDIMEAIEEGGVYGQGENFAMVWVMYGPKENKDLEELTVEIEAGFAKEVK